MKNPQNDLKIIKIHPVLAEIDADSARGVPISKGGPQRGVEGSENLNPNIFGYFGPKPTQINNKIYFSIQILRELSWWHVIPHYKYRQPVTQLSNKLTSECIKSWSNVIKLSVFIWNEDRCNRCSKLNHLQHHSIAVLQCISAQTETAASCVEPKPPCTHQLGFGWGLSSSSSST